MIQDGTHPGPEHQSTMGGRSGGDATVLATEQGCEVPLHRGGHVVQIHLGPNHPKQDGGEVTKAFESIVAEEHRPETLQMDKGKKFYNATMKRWLEDEGIQHFLTLGDAKASIMERFNRTLKTHLHHYFTAANTTRYVDVVPALVQQYN